MTSPSARISLLAAAAAFLVLPAFAQTVKVTPLGGIDGEFCIFDRALVFEDPNGTRILYDPGFTVAGASAASRNAYSPRLHTTRPWVLRTETSGSPGLRTRRSAA